MAIGNTSEFVKQLRKAGLVPDQCKRIVIDIPADDIIKVYYETVADGEKLNNIIIDDIIAKELKACIGNCPKCGENVTDVTAAGDKPK